MYSGRLPLPLAASRRPRNARTGTREHLTKLLAKFFADLIGMATR
jgi:hypothetical protein